MLDEFAPLFLFEHDCRVNADSPTRGKPAGNDRDRQQRGAYRRKRRGIMGTYLKEQRRDPFAQTP